MAGTACAARAGRSCSSRTPRRSGGRGHSAGHGGAGLSQSAATFSALSGGPPRRLSVGRSMQASAAAAADFAAGERAEPGAEDRPGGMMMVTETMAEQAAGHGADD